jgi:hypothetical protein
LDFETVITADSAFSIDSRLKQRFGDVKAYNTQDSYAEKDYSNSHNILDKVSSNSTMYALFAFHSLTFVRASSAQAGIHSGWEDGYLPSQV